MGLVLAIGLVVDDAIVVVEAVKNHISNGEKPLQATIAAMKEVSGPIVSTALVISCVFIPTLLLPGVTGKLFEQFAVTIGMSIIISAFCALSLSPTLSAGLLRGGKADSIPLLGPFSNCSTRVSTRRATGTWKSAPGLSGTCGCPSCCWPP